MKSKNLLSLVAIVATSGLAHAQFFTSGVAVTGNADVLDDGTTVFALSAYDYSGAASTVVNGVTFSGGTTASPLFVEGSISLTLGDGSELDGDGESGLPDNIATAISYYFIAGAQSLTFDGLTPGQAYQAQYFAGSESIDSTETFSDGGGSAVVAFGAGGSDAEFTTELFTPTTSSETIEITPGSTYLPTVINAVVLKTVPEPSTYAMLFGGLGLLVLVSRLRRKLTA